MRIVSRTATPIEPTRVPAGTGAAARHAHGSGNNSTTGPAPADFPLFQTLIGNPAAGQSPSGSSTAQPAATAATTPTTATPATTAAPTAYPVGIAALVHAMMNGTFQASYVTDPSQLVEKTPYGSYQAGSMSYASDETANQLAQLLGGTVVKRQAFPIAQGWQAPLANFIKLPGGQLVNAGDLASYARCAGYGVQQLTADLTQEINQGSAITKLYDYEQAYWSGQPTGDPPDTAFQIGDPGPAIAGMVYPAGTLAADGSVINPANAHKLT
ncbi:MAG: hypothetical protein LAP87_15625 [Acidobacteriia bacterium]|nr:hypothetical protein [Terriglobia bacterium]